MTPKVLIVDDDPEFGLVARNLIELEGYSALLAGSGRDALLMVDDDDFDVLLLDLMLGDVSGLDVLRKMRQRDPLVPVIVVTAHGSMESAAEAVQSEAFDYLGKPFKTAELLHAVRRAVEWRQEQREYVPPIPKQFQPVTSIVGRSPAMVAVYRIIARVAATNSTVLISGESGTGKELVARAIHDNSRRASRPFVPINCGAFTETLLESELFGTCAGRVYRRNRESSWDLRDRDWRDDSFGRNL